MAFVLSATLSGLAGGTKALVFQLASLTDVHWTMSGEGVLMTLLGGLGTVFGPAGGAFIVIGLEHWLAPPRSLLCSRAGAALRGGLGPVFVPAVEGFIVIGLEHWLAQLGSWLTIVQGAIFVVCVLTF